MIDEVNKYRVQLLVDALRSGEFEQATGKLTLIDEFGDESHCCLGVACVVYMRNGGDLKTSVMEECRPGDTRIYGGATEFLPDPVIDWYGFSSCNPTIIIDDDDGWHEEDAAEYNDSGATFNQVADAFQRTYIDPVEETS